VRPGGVVAALALVLAGFGVLPGETGASNGSSPKIGSQVLRDTASGSETQFVVYLGDQADLSAAYAMRDQDARGWYVYRTLREHAARTQAPIIAQLEARGVPYRSFWAANVVMTEGDRSLVDALAARADVKSIESDDKSDLLQEVEVPFDFDSVSALVTAASPSRPAASNAVEWGVNDVHAPALWSAGDTGQGIVVASADTGVRWTHSALRNQYRGWNGTNADNNYNWHDAIHSGGGVCGPDTVQPCDDDSHGTHTTGSAVGSDGGMNQIGVAPGAKWIGCRNMDQGTGSPATYTECFQWFIAPTNLSGQNADPTKRPHVINDSWTCPASEGCAANTLQTIVQNTEAAGIFVEASAGNSGPGCSTVSDPPAIYSSAFSTGAVDSSNTLAGFSSRGPVTADGSNRMKPEIVAPGVNVRSSVRSSDTAYSSFSGTSMAGPHVVGVVALLWSARPDLVRNIAATKQLLTNTANPAVGGGGTGCGGSSVVPNNNFGSGLVDALAAYDASGPSLPRTLTVTKAGKGTGTVTSSPAGINCGTTCSAGFANGSSVTLTASAATGSTFSGWSGSGCSGKGICTVTMSANRSVKASFAKTCTVPQLKGKLLAQATRAIIRARCSVGSVTRAYSSSVKKGRVVSQRPVASAHRAAGVRVNLVISKGKAKSR
jgi:serine protease AprX